MSNQITIPIPTITNNLATNVIGILGSAGLLLQPYLKTGSISVETIILAVLVAVICFFIGRKDPQTEAAAMNMVASLVENTINSKLPAAITAAMPAPSLAVNAADAVVQVAQAQAPAAPVIGG